MNCRADPSRAEWRRASGRESPGKLCKIKHLERKRGARHYRGQRRHEGDAEKRPQSRPIDPTAGCRAGGAEACRSTRDREGQRLDNFLIGLWKGVPKTHVYRVIRSGEVRVNKGRAAADTRLALGDELRLPPVRTSPAARRAHGRRRRRASSRSSGRTRR